MKIYSMTATFGKLDNQTITLTPGLNVIHAPNEWGKSTWCAFLVNMLYGLDTRAKTTKTALSDKEHYAPWSGQPMSGRIDLMWNGMDITIERHTRGRTPFGEFKAYETASGLPIAELDGTNCGQKLLGVERSVFTRAGFLSFSDLPVTHDEALRRRLNNLVSTGDESGAGDRLNSTLRDLRNQCRFNRTGLLPQAEKERDFLEEQIHTCEALRGDMEQLGGKISQAQAWLHQLENHDAALAYAAAEADSRKLRAVKAELDTAGTEMEQLIAQCAALPARAEAERRLKWGQTLLSQRSQLQELESSLPALPEAPLPPAGFAEPEPDTIVEQARGDFAEYEKLQTQRKSSGKMLWIYAAVATAIVTILVLLKTIWQVDNWIPYVAGGAVLVAGALLTLLLRSSLNRKVTAAEQALLARHKDLAPERWVQTALDYVQSYRAHEDRTQLIHGMRAEREKKHQAWQQELVQLAPDGDLTQMMQYMENTIRVWDLLKDAQQRHAQLQDTYRTIAAVVRPVPAPKEADNLTLSQEETTHALAQVRFQLRQLENNLAQTKGRYETLGQEDDLRARFHAVKQRIHKLEDTYNALGLAIDTLSAAKSALQRRFAPRIANHARDLFRQMTAGRYDRLTLSDDFSLNVCAEEESTLRPVLWRSDGTTDQLYFALRLAVAQELTPEAPLILDDALVRFDDARHRIAMDILQQIGQTKQVILFTCQQRENQYVEEVK